MWLQWGSRIKIVLIERVGIRMNEENTMTIVCQTGPIAGLHSATAYEWRMTGERDPQWVRQLRRVACEEFVAYLDVASMDAHIQTQHENPVRARPILQPLPLPAAREHRMALLRTATAIN